MLSVKMIGNAQLKQNVSPWNITMEQSNIFGVAQQRIFMETGTIMEFAKSHVQKKQIS